ncbi:MAG: biliverdin-producing heme oxygenase [Salinibacterium sp.]|nr:biliverdin-producing heme oxygenase [Salinibacterium sp.]
MTVVPFSQLLRERTWSNHSDSEGADFMSDLMSGTGTREDYVALVAQHHFIYAALESAAERFVEDPTAAAFITPQLARVPALEADLDFLIGAHWRESIIAVPTTERYVERIEQIAADDWVGGFIAHHYTRYLGDLSGGQHISKLMKRQFGFETDGVSFYRFDKIANPTEFKNAYREQLDALGWDAAERERVIEEVVRAYRFNTELFVDLSNAKATAS